MIKLTIYSFVFCMLFCNSAVRQKYDYSETSAYVYNFVKYTEWPDKKTTFNVGFVGITPLEGDLKTLVSKKKNSNITLKIKNIKSSEAKTVDVLIVANSSTSEMKAIQALTETSPILVITEKQDQNRFGACISFFIDEDDDFKTKYQLSTRNCKSKGLNVAQQVLSNAVMVK